MGRVDWTELTQDRDKWKVSLNVVMNLQVPQNSGRFSSGCKTSGILSSSQLLSSS
jgi:hypothetical protein